VPLEHLRHRFEEARHHLAQRFGVETLAELRRVGDVGEENRDRSATYSHVLSVGLGLGSA